MDLNQELVRELFEYNPETGHLIWRSRESASRGWNCRMAGKIAGHRGNCGYIKVTITFDGKAKYFRAHRIIWLHFYGSFPESGIDHINHNGCDNRISNLREADQKVNSKNKSKSSRNTSGHAGVTWYKKGGMWQAQIGVDNTTVPLGYFDDFGSAVKARKLAEKKYKFHENHGL